MDSWPTRQSSIISQRLSVSVCLFLMLAAPAAMGHGWGDATSGGSDETIVGASDSAVPLARLLSRAREQAKTPPAGSNVGSPLTRELWSSRVAMPQISEDTESSLDLQRLIQQVRSVRFDGQDEAPTFTAPAEPEPAVRRPASEPSRMSVPQAAVPQKAPAAPQSATALPARTQEALDALRQDPQRVSDALEMAELLFLSGQAAEAAPFYAEALNRLGRTEPAYDTDRAWILFQLGNSLRETDTGQAQEAYTKLISEYPASPWTELARAHGRLLTWYRKNPLDQPATQPQL